MLYARRVEPPTSAIAHAVHAPKSMEGERASHGNAMEGRVQVALSHGSMAGTNAQLRLHCQYQEDVPP